MMYSEKEREAGRQADVGGRWSAAQVERGGISFCVKPFHSMKNERRAETGGERG